MFRTTCALLFLCLALFATSARAETNNCTNITSLPAVISTQGVYCLKQDLSTSIASGAAITIATNNVTIDCNDWKIGGLGGGAATTAYGIAATNRKNVTIRNCGVRGFYLGIFLDGADSAYHLVQDNRVDLSTYRGIFVAGDGGTIRGNRVFDTGSSSLPEKHGITALGAISIIDNTIQGVVGGGRSIGIFLNADSGGFISQNRVSGVAAATNSYGYFSFGRVAMAGNLIVNGSGGAANQVGIKCDGATKGVARDSILIGFGSPAVAISDCTSVYNASP